MANRNNPQMGFQNFSLMVRRSLADLNIAVDEEHCARIARCYQDKASIAATISDIQDAERAARANPFLAAGQSSMAPIESVAAVTSQFELRLEGASA